MSQHIGTYEIIGWKLTQREAKHLRRRMLAYQPYLHQVDIYLLRDTRRVRKIIRRHRAKTNNPN